MEPPCSILYDMIAYYVPIHINVFDKLEIARTKRT